MIIAKCHQVHLVRTTLETEHVGPMCGFYVDTFANILDTGRSLYYDTLSHRYAMYSRSRYQWRKILNGRYSRSY